MPILPKSTVEFRFPPKCPLENVQFMQLRKHFFSEDIRDDPMSAEFNLIGSRRKIIKAQMANLSKETVTVIPDQPQHRIDETTTMKKNVVFARDQTCLEADRSTVDRDYAF